MPPTLQPAAGINGANNGASAISVPSSSASDMNRSPNNTLRVAGGIALSNTPATASRTAEKVFEKITYDTNIYKEHTFTYA